MSSVSSIIKKGWTLYLSRPYNLFTGSIWYHWYESRYWTAFFKIKPPTSILVEQGTGIVRQYWLKKEMAKYNTVRRDIIIHKRAKVVTALNKGDALNKRVDKIFKSNKKEFHNLKESIDFLCEIAFFGTVLPFAILEAINRYEINDTNLINMAQKLRSVSYYPDIQNKIVIPLAEEIAGKHKSLNKRNFQNLITYTELLGGDVTRIPLRIKKRKNGYYFLNLYKGGNEEVFWFKNLQATINILDKLNIGLPANIKGQIAYKDKVSGVTRVVLQPDKKTTFNKGDILITTNSNPSFMPFIKKCSALVTDEGGIMCHASVIARELKIPCVIGTKIATQVFKNGDRVSVDATKWIVRKLSK